MTNAIEAALAAIEELARVDGLDTRLGGRPFHARPGAAAAETAQLRPAAIAAPRILFLPVSGPHGMGEYARAVQIAQAVAARWPDAKIHFALSREAPYEIEPAFAYTLLPSSPTFHTPEVIALIEQMRTSSSLTMPDAPLNCTPPSVSAHASSMSAPARANAAKHSACGGCR